MIVGGWSVSSMEITDAHKELFKKAQETLTGAVYTPIALLGTQVVAGKNYRILCESKASTGNSETGWAILTVYADLEGHAEVTDIAEMK